MSVRHDAIKSVIYVGPLLTVRLLATRDAYSQNFTENPADHELMPEKLIKQNSNVLKL